MSLVEIEPTLSEQLSDEIQSTGLGKLLDVVAELVTRAQWPTEQMRGHAQQLVSEAAADLEAFFSDGAEVETDEPSEADTGEGEQTSAPSEPVKPKTHRPASSRGARTRK